MLTFKRIARLKTTPYRLGFLLATLLSACVPTTTLPDTAALPNARAADTAPFGSYQTYFEVAGREGGQPVLMVHGIGGGSSLFQYRKNSAAFARAGFEVYALDLLGFGRSTRPPERVTQDDHLAQLTSFIETVVAEPTVIVANGLSAAYSVRLAAERPDLVEALVLIGPTGYERLARPKTEARVRAFDSLSGFLGDALYGVLLADNWQRFFLLDAYAGEDSLTPEVLAEFDTQLRAENAKWIILSFVSGNLDQDVSDYWPNVTQPTLTIWGAQAQTTPVEDAEAFLAVRPETELAVIDGAKLVPNEDQPDAFNEVVLEFLKPLF